MFFIRSASSLDSSADLSSVAQSTKPARFPRNRRAAACAGGGATFTKRTTKRAAWRRAVSLALAVTTAVPFAGPAALLFTTRLGSVRAAEINAAAAGALNAYAADNTSADMASSADVAAARTLLDQMPEPVDDAGKLAKGIAQFNAHEYEEAVATLQTVNTDQLSAQGKQSLSDTLSKASAAADQRKDARAEFEKGEQALAANQPGVAMQHYKLAAANYYADDGTVAKAKEQEAVAQEGIKTASVQMKGLYGDAINDYKAGNYTDAKTKFTTLQNAGFRAPLFQRSPSDYLNDIDQKLAQAPSTPSPSTPAPATPAPAPAVPAPEVAVPPVVTPAVAATAPAPSDNASATATTPPAEVATTPPPAPPAPALSPSDAYHLGRKEYNSGDWTAARQNLVIARDGGYKAGLFEDGPEKYLARMDSKEQADNLRHQQELQQQDAAAAAAAAAATAAAAAASAASQPAVAAVPPPASPATEPAAPPTPPAVAVATPPVPAPAVAAPDTTTQPSAQSPTTAPAAVAEATPPTPTPPPAPDPSAAYHLARQQYKQGDWISARQNFGIARDNGYKAGLFEDSPSKYLARMDAKEAADDLRHQQEIRQQEMVAAAAAASAAAASAQASATTAPSAPSTAEAEVMASTAPTTVALAPEAAPAPPVPVPVPATSPAIADNTAPPPPATSPSASESQPTPGAVPAVAPVVATPTAQEELAQTADAERIKQQQHAYEAKQKIADAQDAKAQNRLDDALQLYTEAVNLDPSNMDAINGKNELLTLTGRKPGTSNALDRESRAIEARRQSIQYSFGVAIDEAQTDIDAKKISDAKAAIARARVARNTDPQIFTDEEMRAFDTRIAAADTSLDSASATLSQQDLIHQEQETATRLANEQQVREQQRVHTIADLIGNARSLTEQGKYREALNVIDQILVIDPGNDYAVGVRPLVEDRADFAEQRKYRESYDRNFTSIFNEAEEKRIPYTDILRYPENWPDLSETRDKSVALERGEEVADQAVAAQLDRRLPDIKFDAVGFSDVVDFLRDLTSANIFVNWRALEAAGVDKNAPVTARLRDVPFAKVLRTILDDVSGGTTKLGYTIDEGVITISTEEDLAKNTSTRVYDIRDLIIDVPDFTDAPKFDLSQQQSSGTTVGGSGGGGNAAGGGNLFGGGGGGGGDTKGPTRTELVEAIIKLIQDTVSSDSWKDNGGNVGSIRELGGQLIVTQTPENQRELVKLLDQLREQRALQVTIETRFLFVQRNFLDSLGVNFNFSFGNGPGGVAGNIPNPITVTQNSSSFTLPASLGTAVPGNLATEATTPNLTTGLTFLSDFQANLVVQATQDETNSSNLTAPRVTLFNGQRAYVLVSTETAYVSNLTPVVGAGAAGFNPTISVLQSGVVLDVTATISADRKYVTLTLRPTLSTLENLLSFPVALAVGSTGVVAGGGAATVTSSIQEPEIEITTVRTTVSVPDGGTLLLGGQTLSAEVDRESGVPILSDIPFLKRLFTNRGMAKDDQVLLILVKPTIIIQREREAEEFPLLNTQQQ